MSVSWSKEGINAHLHVNTEGENHDCRCPGFVLASRRACSNAVEVLKRTAAHTSQSLNNLFDDAQGRARNVVLQRDAEPSNDTVPACTAREHSFVVIYVFPDAPNISLPEHYFGVTEAWTWYLLAVVFIRH